jgi:murein DD-endopeptidase MepM/ murein hydrolase activator NlpD
LRGRDVRAPDEPIPRVPRRILVVLLLALITAAPAAGDNATRKAQVDSEISSLNEKIAAARAKEQRLASEIAAVTTKIRSLESEIGDVESDLHLLEQDLALQRERLAKITELWRLQTEKLAFLRRQHTQAIDRLSRRLIAIYQAGNPTIVDVLLESSSFSEVLSRYDYAKDLAAQDQRIAASVGKARNQMRVAQARTTVTRKSVQAVAQAVAVRTQQTRDVRNELVARENALAGSRAKRREALVAVQKSKEEYLHEVNALLAVSAQLSGRIQASQSSSVVVRSSSGLIWPCSGPVTSGFGWRWGRMHEGIDIAVSTGTPIMAAAAGQVIHAGWLGGYGNLVVIDHGGGLATAYGHNSSIAVGYGSSVGQGQVISYAGSTGYSTGPHLHFEVRVNGSAVDPLGYLG